MRTSIATVSIAGELRDKLAAIAGAGFDGIEIFEQDFIAHSGTPTEIGEMVRDHGLRIDLMQPVRDVEGLPEPLRSKAFDRVERRFDLMEQLGTDLLLVSSGTHPASLGGIDRMAADFAELGDRAAARGLRIGYEARAWGRHVSDYRDAWEVVRRASRPNVGLILDSFHTLAKKVSPEAIRSIPGDRIFHVQLADAPLIEMDLEYMSRHFRRMPGEGDLPLLDFMRAVAATGYDGAFSLEILNDQLRGGAARIAALDGRRSLIYLADQLRRAEPSLPVDLPEMPERGRVEGIEFVEFTANETEAKILGGMLSALGFSRVARHISKAVTLWRQGDINIVVNTEQEGFAHSAYVMHGTSVCDIGLLVEDASATVERARVLGANLFSQKIGAGELKIPAVRGVGGTVLHFLDRHSDLGEVWEREFQPLEGEEGVASAGLSRIDHIAQVMKHDEMLTWTLFYTSVFDIAAQPEVDVADPGGIVHSRALQSSDGAVRLTLNGVDTHHTFAGRFVSDSYGSSVQHLAFATDDIFATAESLASNGFDSLPIPEDYFAEIRSRFSLPEETIVALKRANIFYDEDGAGGSYFQFYSRPYGDGMFFEIVERRGGYDGYGARNAPYRTAALKRIVRTAGIQPR
ncbi:bifunctional sugar phosphate isomerase/epimerase/4-hydroxyphenylpyruvate dioxygenase family protein [Aliiruegeria sabulilitoris]|uniref:bifunctional sugar phosphate isomerase/epimerase/4-hydroxyphenylpyruvate dioxygenase family protein n=1 Tax=Aliiruegeria sabulilitoris TaxID=1510458 RepID=UPI00082FEC83|nr:sugar phosphate isomerase/epimerase and 4-hydroxyphenylpyruvate domain-containing protein [Aliiruegeria sabulilitoris]NDR55494.1 sugar phosphate isomerase/epimerase and 4-hydroxyphenylpyruvate domain-containing protein [Pseudoruegeria sp. M32A2M]